jgi:hypothetical protein
MGSLGQVIEKLLHPVILQNLIVGLPDLSHLFCNRA